MSLPELVLSGAGILKKIGGLIRPKKRGDQRALSDSSITQRSIFGKNEITLVYPQGQKVPFLARDELPKEVIAKIKEQYSKKNLDVGKEGIRLITNAFKEDINRYQKEYSKPSTIDDIIPLLDHKYKSILKLSLYVERLLRDENHERVKEVKRDISRHYGKEGTTLCRLYSAGYLDKFIEYFSAQISKKNIDKRALSKFVNKELSEFIEESKFLFFIQQGDNIIHVAHKIVNQMEDPRPFMAIHASGYWNIKKAKKILKIIEEDIEKYEYRIKEINNPVKCSGSPIYYISLVNKKVAP